MAIFKKLALGWLCLMAVIWIAERAGRPLFSGGGRPESSGWNSSAQRAYWQCRGENPELAHASCAKAAERTQLFTGGYN